MSIQIAGNSGVVADVNSLDTGFRSTRVASYPADVGARGAYAVGLFTGILPAALAANSTIFSFRWSHATLLCIPRSVRVGASVSTTMFAAGVPVELDLSIARGWTVADSSGTGIAFGANDAKKRSQFSTTAMASGDVRQSLTAALTVGTRTLDSTPLTRFVAGGPITGSLNGTIIQPGTILWLRDSSDEYPIIFEQNEGFVVRSIAVPGTGTWRAVLHVEWMEIDPTVRTEWA